MKKNNLFILLTICLFTMSFTLNNVFLAKKVYKETSTPEEYDEGYKDGYCEGFKEVLESPYMACPRVPYIDNAKYLDGCESWKCGYNAGFKHGTREGKKYKVDP
jgi:hypothetical protein